MIFTICLAGLFQQIFSVSYPKALVKKKRGHQSWISKVEFSDVITLAVIGLEVFNRFKVILHVNLFLVLCEHLGFSVA